MNLSDCYVSLHRSEGLGLPMIEAMLLGKPVIATAYSGNMDFMDRENSLLVPYRLTTLDRDFPPYAKGMRWADPDHDDAAAHMRWAAENRSALQALGERAKATTTAYFNPASRAP